MRLYFQGIPVPKLGSSQDRVLRDFLVRQDGLEVKRQKMAMLQLLTNPQIQDSGKARQWVESVNDMWKEYLYDLYNVETSEVTKEEDDMKAYYDRVVSKFRPVLTKTEDGKLKVTGIDKLLKSFSS